MSIKFNANDIRIIALFEDITGAVVKDCIIDDENDIITFVVKNGDMGLAIGKGGKVVSKVRKTLDKTVVIIEFNEDPTIFVENVLSPAKLKSVTISTKKTGEKIAFIRADNHNKRIAIGKKGAKIQRAKTLLNRQHNIDNIIIK